MGEKQDCWDGKTLPFGEDCYDYCRRVFFNRWKPRIIHAIQFDNDCTRFSRFTRQLPISEKVLAQNLRELEEDGIITRTVYPETPIRVEYHLTPAGKSLCALLDAIYDWGWHQMRECGLDIDPLGEMWHGYRTMDPDIMEAPDFHVRYLQPAPGMLKCKYRMKGRPAHPGGLFLWIALN